MRAYAWLGPLRQTVRSGFFRVLRQALLTEDGKRIVADSLRGLLTPAIPPHLGATPYAHLGGRRGLAGTANSRPVFVTARFRTGSTLLWRVFREIPSCTAYYEPLNERRWFDPDFRGDEVDASHGVGDYWREYDGLLHLARWYRPEWTSRALYMGRGAVDNDLYHYVRALIEAAAGRPVLQFNRVDFRLEWLRHNFPNALVIHLYRHPREQWCSTLMGDSFPLNGTVADFARQDRFYLLSWATDLSYHFPFLDARAAGHPYALFYLIWRLSFAFGTAHAHASFCYESLCESPRHELHRLLVTTGIEADVDSLLPFVRNSRSRFRDYAPDEWFVDIETQCDELLERVCAQRRHDESFLLPAVRQSEVAC